MASLQQQLESSPPHRITVIRTDRVGDLILSTPFLAGLRRGFPQAQITALVAPYCRDVLARSGLVDRVVSKLDDASPCDLAIALAPRSESLRQAWRTRAPQRLGYVYTNRPLVRWAASWYLTHWESIRIQVPDEVPHEVEQLDRLARCLGLPSTCGFPLQIGPRVARVPGRLLFHLGDRWLTGDWDLKRVRALIEALSALGQVVVTTGPREEALLADEPSLFSGVDIRRGLSFEAWADLIGSSEIAVSPDTGAVHLAAAMGTPVVVAYEPSTFELCSRQWAPWKIAHRSLVKGAPQETIARLLELGEDLLATSRIDAS